MMDMESGMTTRTNTTMSFAPSMWADSVSPRDALEKERMTIMLNTLMDQGRMMAQNELSSPNELTSR